MQDSTYVFDKRLIRLLQTIVLPDKDSVRIDAIDRLLPLHKQDFTQLFYKIQD